MGSDLRAPERTYQLMRAGRGGVPDRAEAPGTRGCCRRFQRAPVTNPVYPRYFFLWVRKGFWKAEESGERLTPAVPPMPGSRGLSTERRPDVAACEPWFGVAGNQLALAPSATGRAGLAFARRVRGRFLWGHRSPARGRHRGRIRRGLRGRPAAGSVIFFVADCASLGGPCVAVTRTLVDTRHSDALQKDRPGPRLRALQPRHAACQTSTMQRLPRAHRLAGAAFRRGELPGGRAIFAHLAARTRSPAPSILNREGRFPVLYAGGCGTRR